MALKHFGRSLTVSMTRQIKLPRSITGSHETETKGKLPASRDRHVKSRPLQHNHNGPIFLDAIPPNGPVPPCDESTARLQLDIVAGRSQV